MDAKVGNRKQRRKDNEAMIIALEPPAPSPAPAPAVNRRLGSLALPNAGPPTALAPLVGAVPIKRQPEAEPTEVKGKQRRKGGGAEAAPKSNLLALGAPTSEAKPKNALLALGAPAPAPNQHRNLKQLQNQHRNLKQLQNQHRSLKQLRNLLRSLKLTTAGKRPNTGARRITTRRGPIGRGSTSDTSLISWHYAASA
jgi:hypothetical protein